MANQLHIYYGNISKEGTDGTEASAGTGLSPISVTLDAAKGILGGVAPLPAIRLRGSTLKRAMPPVALRKSRLFIFMRVPP